MAKCLVTKLQASVDNDSLIYLKEVDIKLNVSETAAKRFAQFKASESVSVKSTIPLYSDSSYTDAIGTEFTVPANTNKLCYYKSVPGIIKIIDGKGCMMSAVMGSATVSNIESFCFNRPSVFIWKNVQGGSLVDTPDYALFNGNIDYISNRDDSSIQLKVIDGGFYSFAGVYGKTDNLSKFTFASNSIGKCRLRFFNSDMYGSTSVFSGFSTAQKNIITGIDIPISTISVNVGDFSAYTNLEQVNFYTNPNVSGSLVAAFGRMVNLDYFDAGGHSGSEDMKNLFDALYANGKVSGGFTCYAGTNKTLNGGTWINGKRVTFNSSGWSIE